MKFDKLVEQFLTDDENVQHIDGLYVVKDSNGTITYYADKELSVKHREDGPAIITPKGSEHWYYKGVRHRVGGPAVTYWTGTEAWMQNDVYHREDGPAYISHDGTEKRWYIHGQEMSEEEFNRYITKQTAKKEIQSHKNNRIDAGMLEDYL